MSNRIRLDHALVTRRIASTRSQADTWIRLGDVTVDGAIVTKSGTIIRPEQAIALTRREQYVSRAGLKLASVAAALDVDFNEKIVLDVGSSTGGFTDYALQHGAKKVIAVDVGTDQLHPSLRSDERVELHEKTDIRDFHPADTPAIVVIDVSFISVRQIFPHVVSIADKNTHIVAMVKPQFEAGRAQLTKQGIVKNDRIRRDILSDFEQWVKQYARIIAKRDSEVSGAHGNIERFYLLQKTA